MERALLEAMAHLFEYPEEGTLERAVRVKDELVARGSAALALLGPWLDWVTSSSLEEVQESFTRWFDMNPSGCPEVGWHLFGENYERGELLVELRCLLREVGYAERGELPDHLCHVLVALARASVEDAEPLARKFVANAIEKMLEGHGRNAPTRALLEATRVLVIEQFGEPVPLPPQNRSLPLVRDKGGPAHV